MPRYDPIVPRPDIGREVPDAIRRARYQEMLRDELGRRPQGFYEAAPERAWSDLIAPVIGMIVLAGMVLAGLYTFRLWQEGEIGWRLPEGGPTFGQRVWQHQDRRRPAEDTVPAESEVERTAVPVEAVEEEADEAEAVEE